MRTFTVGELVTRLRRLGDYQNLVSEQQGSYTDDYMSDPIIIEMIDVAYARAYEELSDADEDWKATRYTLSLAAGSGSYDLPDDVYKLRSVEVSQNSSLTGWVPLPRATVDDDVGQNSANMPRAYRLLDDQIELLPTTASSTAQVRLTYVPEPTHLTGSGDIVDSECGLDQLTVLGALRLARIREEKPIGDIQLLYGEQLDRSFRSLRRRDRATPRRLRDPRDGNGGRGGHGRRY